MNERDRLILTLAVTQGTRNLIRGLLERNVKLAYATNYYVARNRGQGNMNKAAGELAPTWWLAQDGIHDRHGWHNGDPGISVVWNGRKFRGINGYLPLTWILKAPAADWDLNPRHEADDELDVSTPGLPPWWT